MKRNLVQIARIRMQEVVPGDVVNRNPDDNRGWFVAGIVEPLFDGTLQVSDRTRTKAFAAMPLDIIGVQLLKPIDLEVTEKVGRVVDEIGQVLDDDEDEDQLQDELQEEGVIPAEAHETAVAPAGVANSEVIQPVLGQTNRPVPRPDGEGGGEAAGGEAAPAQRRTVRSLFEG